MDFQQEALALIHSGVMPALGCTEPGAVALAAAHAAHALHGQKPLRVDVSVDANVYKNGVAVGVPGTGQVGLAIAAALGALIGDPSRQLSVLGALTPETLLEADRMLAENRVRITLNDSRGLCISASVSGTEDNARAVIRDRHTRLALLEKNGEILEKAEDLVADRSARPDAPTSARLADFIAAAAELPLVSLSVFEESLRMNLAAAEAGLNGRLGMAVGANLRDLITDGVLADDPVTAARVMTAAAADARMSGENIAVMSVAGSGNHGLTAILPVAVVADRMAVPRPRLLQALAVSALTTLYIKRHTGNLSALCGCAVAAATGASAAIVWMLGGTQEQIDGTVKNMIANLTGMICDGGKEGCALKLSAAAGVAVETALLSLRNVVVPVSNGIIFPSSDDTIRNLGLVSNPGMLATDKVILEILREKELLPSLRN